MSNLPNPIGLTGRATSGKDSVGQILVSEYQYTRVAFADALKSMALALDPIVDRLGQETLLHPVRLHALVRADGWEAAKMNPEVRRFLQALGTEAVRDHLGEDAWIRALDLHIRGLAEEVLSGAGA